MAKLIPYRLCFSLGAFHPGLLDPQHLAEAVRGLVVALTVVNMEYLDSYPAPPLYLSGVVYRADGDSIEKQWWDVPTISGHGFGDCKGLAAWRVAELRLDGTPAEPHVIVHRRTDGSVLYHVKVRLPGGGEEDPSRRLGMH